MNRIKAIGKVFLATILISIVGSYINAYVYSITKDYAITLITSQILLVLPTIVYIIINKVNVLEFIRLKGISISTVILLILFNSLITPLMNLINALSMLFVKNDTTPIMNSIVSNRSLLFSLVLIGIVPAILEEMVYRGVFYNEFRKVNILKGIILSGFLFGILHGNLNQFSYTFVMGIIFALVIEATDSVLSTMIMHFCINGTSVIIMYLYPKFLLLMEGLYGRDMFNASEIMESFNAGNTEQLTLEVIGIYAGLALICTILAFLVFKTIAKNNGRWDIIKGIFKNNKIKVLDEQSNTRQNVKEKRLITPSLLLGIIICIILIIVSEIRSNISVSSDMEGFLSIIKIFR